MERISQTLIMTVWEGSSFSTGSWEHPDTLLSLLIGVPSHLTAGLPTAEARGLSAFPLSKISVAFRSLIGNPRGDISEKKSVILVFGFPNPSGIVDSFFWLSSKAFSSGLLWGRSWGVSGWVPELESDRSGLRLSGDWVEGGGQVSALSLLSWVGDASALIVLTKGLTNHCWRVLRASFWGGMVLGKEPFLLIPRTPPSPVFGLTSIFVPLLISLLSPIVIYL